MPRGRGARPQLARLLAVDERRRGRAGAAELRASIRINREHDDLSDRGSAYNNYADLLHLHGRSDEARAVTLEGRDVVAGRRPSEVMWLDIEIAEIAFDVGEWELAEASLPTPRPWTGTQSRLGIGLRRAALAAGRGDHAAALALLREIEPMGADSGEPQVFAQLGPLEVELRRREGDLDAARAAGDHWLERIELGGADAMGLAALAAAGVTVEADAAERARDVGDAGAEAAALRRVDELLARGATAVAAASPGRARASGRRPRRGGPRRGPARPGGLRARPRQPGTRSAGRSRRRACAGARPRRTSPPATARPPRSPPAPRTRRLCGSAPAGCGARSRASPRAPGSRSSADATSSRPRRTRSASPSASARCWRCWPRARPTARSGRRSSWPRRRPASTSRGSSRS